MIFSFIRIYRQFDNKIIIIIFNTGYIVFLVDFLIAIN